MTEQALPISMARLQDYVALAKLRLVSLTLLSVAVGFYLATPGPMDLSLFTFTLLGAGLVAAGSMILNQWMERVEDAKMARTAKRPLPMGRLEPKEALVLGLGLSFAGLALLYFTVNLAAAFVAVLVLISYVLAYTPLKKKTTLCTVVGALPGALPPLLGWAGAAGIPTYHAWTLFAIIFFWQMPHFLAIAWLCRKEYAAAGFCMLSVNDPDGRRVAGQIIFNALILLPVSVLPSVVGITGYVYFFGAFFMGVGFLLLGILSQDKLDQRARSLFRASILHLFLLFLLMFGDKI
jgi:protoheme IX farnesyltransferase